MHSAFPGNRLILHTIAFCSGSYLARPNEFLIFDLDVFFGTGILMTTWVANNFSEKLAMTFKLMEHLISKKNNKDIRWQQYWLNEVIVAEAEFSTIMNLLCLPLLLNRRNQPKRYIHIVIHAITHQLKLPIGRDKSDGSIGIELSKSDTPMESAVIDFHP
jgi:hypothetical protein